VRVCRRCSHKILKKEEKTIERKSKKNKFFIEILRGDGITFQQDPSSY